ncbi:MAG: prepilin-type N-terminal cleavage/methylation domain-containing protein [Candidatus Riflebacteria bacterium]|nr:prepilin-type N-terminal cleavage/methylation domain-containing protein [Candidatus Riflebacteria bacterium]
MNRTNRVNQRERNVREGFTLVEVMIAVLIIGAGVIPVMAMFMQSSRTVEKGGAILEATIAAQNILDRAKSDAFLWSNIPLEISIPDDKFPQFKLPNFFAEKYKASGTLKIELAPGHTVLGTGEIEQNLIQLTVTVNWIEYQSLRTSRLITYQANTNSFDLKTSARF